MRTELYGERPAAGVTRTRSRPLGAREAEWAGRLFGDRYRLLARVGGGGMATVHRARDERLARDVAVKVLAERYARDPVLVRQFRHEAQICGGLAHPNVVSVLDAGVLPREFIVMELVDGIDAATLLKRQGRPTLGEAIHVVAQVSAALAHAHDEGVIHGDVSTRNILIRWPDQTAKLADFGLASRPVESAARQVTAGTPGYIAPEVLLGEDPTPRSDLYSLGEVAKRLLAGPAPAALEDRTRLPRALSDAVERAVAEEPDARQASVAEFRADLIGSLRTPVRQLRPAA